MSTKICSCNRCYITVRQWQALDYVGIHRDVPPYPDLELRNCVCGSTISVPLPIGEFFIRKNRRNKRG